MSEPPRLPERPSWAQVGAVSYFVLATSSLVWPVFFWFGNHVEPRVFGLPWSLIYVLLVIAANFLVLYLCYRAGVVRADEVDPRDEDPRP